MMNKFKEHILNIHSHEQLENADLMGFRHAYQIIEDVPEIYQLYDAHHAEIWFIVLESLTFKEALHTQRTICSEEDFKRHMVNVAIALIAFEFINNEEGREGGEYDE